MLKKRIIPIQLLLGNRLVKTIKFDKYRDVGNPISSSKIYNDSDADELMFVNIDRENRSINNIIPLIKEISEVCFMPLSIGGGINSFDDVSKLIKNGADKVIINSLAYQDQSIIQSITDAFGSQAVIISIDAKYTNNEGYSLYSDCGRKEERIELKDHIENCLNSGIGEIFINSINTDGMMQGYDIKLIEKVMDYSKVPVIACGGAGTFEHMRDAFLKTNVSALACGSLFNFCDNNPIRAKAFLSNYGLSFKVI